ncbi:hypothetical protein WJX81_001085 [Elliptochloris bilobata]|uniref:Uncharacterized protein n=1 Tax=Elliptochloris bilobata TaxID=381761 RepID=A0AAW1RH20_9CHLO
MQCWRRRHTCWIVCFRCRGAPAAIEAAAREALSQATSDIFAAYKLAELNAAGAPDFAAAVRGAAAGLITALEVVSVQSPHMP